MVLHKIFKFSFFSLAVLSAVFNVAKAQDADPTAGFGVQAAWLNPTANLGEGQSKPGYSKVSWEPGTFIPVRLRDGMTTMINFPDWEKIKDAYIGDKDFFDGRPISKNTFMVTPVDGRSMADTNLTIIGDSGNKYIFYLKSEPVNTETTTNMEVDVMVPMKYRKGTSFATGMATGGTGSNSGSALQSINSGRSGSGAGQDFMLEGEDFGWIKSIPIDPTEFRFDLDIFVPNPDDYIIAPERVWRDQVFTYIDFGEKAIYMTQRPTASLLVEGGEAPVGFRTEGPNSRLLVIEGVGDIILRSGQRIVCIKKRNSPFLLSAPPEPFMVPVVSDANAAAVMNPAMAPGAPLQMGAPVGQAIGVGAMGYMTDPSFQGYAGQGGQYPMTVSQMIDTLDPAYAGGDPNQNNINKTNAFALPSHYVPIVKQGKINFAIELARGKSPKELDEEWYKIQSAFEFLKEFTPYYSVETKGVDELGAKQYKGNEFYRLRIGPFANVEEADNICRKLASFQTNCTVVRIQ